METKIDYFKYIKERHGMDKVLSHYRHFKDASGKYNCPFHHDTPPNDFHVTNDEIGYCFSSNCNKWGDIYDVIQAKENCSKFEALKKAAELAGIEIKFDTKTNEELVKLAEEKEKIKRRTEVLTAATEIFHKNLNDKHRKALKKERGWSDETINEFKIGFSVPGIKNKLINKGFKEEDIVGGLVSDKGFEYFKGRFMFPYIKGNKTAYFIGRETKETPKDDLMKGKYIKLKSNYLENPIFNTDHLNKSQELFITEGIADCISLHQAGFSCISPVTVRFKKEDFPKLLKYAKNREVYIANDNETSDEGMEGALATAKYLFENEVSNVQIIVIPKPKAKDKIDTCDYLKDKKDKNKAVIELIKNNSSHVIDFLINQIKNKTDFNKINEIFDLMASNESIILDSFLKNMQKKSGISVSNANKKIRKIRRANKEKNKESLKKSMPSVSSFEEPEPIKEYSDVNDEYLGIKRFNKSSRLFIPKENPIYTHKVYGYKNDASYFDTTYSIYKTKIAAGNESIFVYSTKHDKIENGEVVLYLTPLEEKEVRQVLKDMAGAKFLGAFVVMHLGMPVKDITYNDLIESVIEKHKRRNQPIFFKKTLAIPYEELEEISDFYELIKNCVSPGVKVDKNIKDGYISLIPEVNPEKITPFQFMKTANHSLTITNSAVGKTTIGMIVSGEPVISDFSSANLLGFATAESKVRGKLDGRTRPTILDEMQELKDEEILGKLLTYMAQGECSISKGIGIKCRGNSVLVFQGNPKTAGRDVDNKIVEVFGFVRQFREFLMKISTNARALSKRIGEVNVGLDYNTIEGSGVSEERFEKGQQIIRTIAEASRDGFTDLLQNTKADKWLTKGYDSDYLDKVDKFAKECQDFLTSEFLEGQKINFRSVRGGALRRAWIKVGLSRFFKKNKIDNKDVDEILESAEDFFNILIAKNLKSYANIVKSINSEEMYSSILEMNLKNLRPEYARIMFSSLFEYCIFSQTTDKIIPINLLEDHHKTIRDSMDIGRKYEYFSRVKEPFEKHIGHLGFHLGEFGLDYDKTISSFIVENSTKFSGILEVYKKWKVKQVQ